MSNKMIFEKINIEDFIKKHTHIYYCEAIIYPDGDITYAVPSHQQALMKITGKTMDELWDIIPQTASPYEWLIDYTKCIAVWYDGFKIPTGSELYYREEELAGIFLTSQEKSNRYDYTVSKEQLHSLHRLIEENIIRNNPLR